MNPWDSTLDVFDQEYKAALMEYERADEDERDRLIGKVQLTRHVLEMRKFEHEWDRMREQMEARIVFLQRQVAEATASEVWDYRAPENAAINKFDQMLGARVKLEAQQMYVRHDIPTVVTHRMDRQELDRFEVRVTESMQFSLRELVYGFPHRPIATHTTHVEEVVSPASWWQMFKRDVLKRTGIKTTTERRRIGMRVSAKPFSAFPELPFKADPRWGPRIDLMLPTDSSVYRMVDRP